MIFSFIFAYLLDKKIIVGKVLYMNIVSLTAIEFTIFFSFFSGDFLFSLIMIWFLFFNYFILSICMLNGIIKKNKEKKENQIKIRNILFKIYGSYLILEKLDLRNKQLFLTYIKPKTFIDEKKKEIVGRCKEIKNVIKFKYNKIEDIEKILINNKDKINQNINKLSNKGDDK